MLDYINYVSKVLPPHFAIVCFGVELYSLLHFQTFLVPTQAWAVVLGGAPTTQSIPLLLLAASSGGRLRRTGKNIQTASATSPLATSHPLLLPFPVPSALSVRLTPSRWLAGLLVHSLHWRKRGWGPPSESRSYCLSLPVPPLLPLFLCL